MAVVPLTRGFASIFGNPVIRAVDTDIFTLRYFTRCMACDFCHDHCCTYGVDIDVENARRLKEFSSVLEAYVGVPASDWFTTEEISDAEFPSGRHVRTRTLDGACVFLNRQSRGCKIHSWSVENGVDYHVLKPMISVLFPATFDHGRIGALVGGQGS